MQRAFRNIKVAAAQLGPIQKAETRQAVVARMLELMRQAEGCDLIVYPELALTTFFPRWFMTDEEEIDAFCERAMASAETETGVAKAGVEEGCELIGGSCIIAATGQQYSEAEGERDETHAVGHRAPRCLFP